MNKPQWYTFKGYQAGYKPSEVSGLPRLYYDRSKPYEKQIRIFNDFIPGNFVTRPEAYIIPQGWWAVIELLQGNKVQMRRLDRDTAIEVETYTINDFKTATSPYEKHYFHYGVKTSVSKQKFRSERAII